MPVTGGSAPCARHVRYGADSPQALPPSTIFRKTTTMFSTATASSRRGLLSAGALWAALLAAGCATAPEPAPEPVAPPPPAPVAEAPAPAPPPRLIFAGFALHSQAKAFRNDVLAAEKLARQMDPNALILKLANPARDQPSDWPQATLENFELVMTKMAEVARPQDRVMLLISTHSNPGTLNINIAGKNAAPITARGLSDALAPLAKTPTLVVLSACYSGAFLQPRGADAHRCAQGVFQMPVPRRIHLLCRRAVQPGRRRAVVDHGLDGRSPEVHPGAGKAQAPGVIGAQDVCGGRSQGLGQPAAQELAASPLSRGRNSPNGRRTN